MKDKEIKILEEEFELDCQPVYQAGPVKNKKKIVIISNEKAKKDKEKETKNSLGKIEIYNNEISNLSNKTISNEAENEITKTPSTKNFFKVIPLGGLEQIGMNMTAFEYKNSIIVVDCGIAFPDEASHPGIDAIIPDITYLRDNYKKIKGFFITHGHEDHIGALPYIIPRLNVPIYGTPLTIELVKYKLKELRGLTVEYHTMNFGDVVKVGDISVECIQTNHSIVDAAALAISTEIGTIIHTGDFKVDYTPIYNDRIDIARFAELGNQGVLAMFCDSTNAERPGFTPSEKTVGPLIDNLFAQYKDKRIIISTFASNVDRVQQIIDIAYKHNRKVILEGKSMVAIINIASEIGRIKLPPKTLIEEGDMGNYKDKDLCIIATGSQGEEMAALSRMANQSHKIKITPNDVIIFSSHPIPGNEKSISNIVNALRMQGAEICYHDVHVSGHACQEEIKLMYALVRPKYAIPAHGEYKHRVANGKIAELIGIPPENVFILNSGSVLAFTKSGKAKITTSVPHGCNYVDSYSGEIIDEIVLYDRQRLSKSGFVQVTIPIEKYSNVLLGDVEVTSRGLTRFDTSKELFDDIKAKTIDILSTMADKNGILKNINKNRLHDELREYIMLKTNKQTMVIVTILPINCQNL